MPKEMLSKHFSRDEVQCNCCGKIGPYDANLKRLLEMLEKLRDKVGKPITIKPGHCVYRCPKHNRVVGGVEGSLHTMDMAADLHVDGMTVDQVANAAREIGFGGVGRYYNQGFVHVDIGQEANWVG